VTDRLEILCILTRNISNFDVTLPGLQKLLVLLCKIMLRHDGGPRLLGTSSRRSSLFRRAICRCSLSWGPIFLSRNFLLLSLAWLVPTSMMRSSARQPLRWEAAASRFVIWSGALCQWVDGRGSLWQGVRVGLRMVVGGGEGVLGAGEGLGLPWFDHYWAWHTSMNRPWNKKVTET